MIDPDLEALEELRALRQLDTPREKLLTLFGPNGLDRIEPRNGRQRPTRERGKVIDGEVIPEAARDEAKNG